jgi:hypothetical protein
MMGAGRMVAPSIRPGDEGRITLTGMRIDFGSVRTQLTVDMTLTVELEALAYNFDYRREGTLLWRADCHPGHEAEFGGPYHLHLGPSEHVRVASPPYSLQDVTDLVARTNRGLLP